MAILALTGEQVQIQISNKAIALTSIIPHAKHLHVLMPDNIIALASGSHSSTVLAHNLNKLQSKQLLEDLQHTLDGLL